MRRETPLPIPTTAPTTFSRLPMASTKPSLLTPTTPATNYASTNRSLIFPLILPSASNTSLTYDALGRVSMAVDPIGTINYSYDNNGRVKSTAETISGTAITISRQYDFLGRLTQFTDA